MRVLQVLLGMTLCCLLPTNAKGDGLVYALPADGTWAKFSVEGVVLDSAGKSVDPVLNITGTLTLGCVGVVQRDGERCRWIEIVIDGQRDGKTFREVDKLLIPEEHLGAGKYPLKYLREAWYMHSAVDNGKARRLKDKEISDIACVQRVRSILHPPFKNVTKKGESVVDCKLGKVACQCVAVEEDELLPGSKIQYGSSSVIWLHQDAPFGVAAWQATSRVYRKGELEGGIQLMLTLVDFGRDGESSLSVAE